MIRHDPGTDFPGPSWVTWESGTSPKDFDSTLASRRRRVRTVLAGILDIVPARVSLSVIEAPSYGSQHGSASEREWLRGMLVDQLLARGPVAEIAPTTRALLATGNGRADKKQVLEAVRASHPLASVSSHDVADAVTLAAAGAHQLGYGAPYSAKQEAAHSRVAWPINREKEVR